MQTNWDMLLNHCCHVSIRLPIPLRFSLALIPDSTLRIRISISNRANGEAIASLTNDHRSVDTSFCQFILHQIHINAERYAWFAMVKVKCQFQPRAAQTHTHSRPTSVPFRVVGRDANTFQLATTCHAPPKLMSAQNVWNLWPNWKYVGKCVQLFYVV